MSVFAPTYDGAPIFGLATHVQMLPNATQHQIDSFFGVSGNVSLFGGSRGRSFLISGVLVATVLDPTDEADAMALLNTQEALIHSYADGIARTFTDNRGNIWPFTFFRDEFQPSADGPRPFFSGWVLPYRCVFHSLV